MKQAGVYTILNLVTGRCYVGSSVNVPHRWREHLSQLTRGVHLNLALQADWTRYGAPSFSWTLTQACLTRAEAIRAEQVHIDANPELYNAARRAGSGPRDGFKHTPEAVQKMVDANLGKPKSAAHRAKISAHRKGRPNPKQGDALRGRKHSPEHCAKISLGNTGKVKSPETRALMSQLLTGRVITWGEKISAGKRGHVWSDERRATLARAQADTQKYDALRAKLSQAMRGRHAPTWSALRRERWNAKHS